MSQEASPHIALAVNVNHEVRELGPMTKMLLALNDWQSTQIPNLLLLPSAKAYELMSSAEDVAVLEHRQIERFHGRERTDHPDSSALLDNLPAGLWSQGPDVGFCHSSPPIMFDLTDTTPIWQKQYPHKPAAEEGIQDTIEGLLVSAVLEHSESDWNTLVLPVEKANTGKYRMAHDL